MRARSVVCAHIVVGRVTTCSSIIIINLCTSNLSHGRRIIYIQTSLLLLLSWLLLISLVIGSLIFRLVGLFYFQILLTYVSMKVWLPQRLISQELSLVLSAPSFVWLGHISVNVVHSFQGCLLLFCLLQTRWVLDLWSSSVIWTKYLAVEVSLLQLFEGFTVYQLPIDCDCLRLLGRALIIIRLFDRILLLCACHDVLV